MHLFDTEIVSVSLIFKVTEWTHFPNLPGKGYFHRCTCHQTPKQQLAVSKSITLHLLRNYCPFALSTNCTYLLTPCTFVRRFDVLVIHGHLGTRNFVKTAFASSLVSTVHISVQKIACIHAVLTYLLQMYLLHLQ